MHFARRVVSRPRSSPVCSCRPCSRPDLFQGHFAAITRKASDIRIHQPGSAVDLTFTSVPFEAGSHRDAAYGYRVGYASARRGPNSAEFEFLHMKAHADARAGRHHRAGERRRCRRPIA